MIRKPKRDHLVRKFGSARRMFRPTVAIDRNPAHRVIATRCLSREPFRGQLFRHLSEGGTLDDQARREIEDHFIKGVERMCPVAGDVDLEDIDIHAP